MSRNAERFIASFQMLCTGAFMQVNYGTRSCDVLVIADEQETERLRDAFSSEV